MKCNHCNKEINDQKFRAHLKRHHLHEFPSLKELTIHVINKVHNLDFEIINRIIHEYIHESVSTLSLCSKYKFNFRMYISDLGLKHKTISEGTSSKSSQNKRKSTFIEKYGVDNVSKNEEIKEKKRQTFINHYGVDNIWKTPTYREEWEKKVLKKYGKVCLSNIYGNNNSFGWKTITPSDKINRIEKLHDSYLKWYYELTPEELEKVIEAKSTATFISSLEKRISKILDDNGIQYSSQIFITRHSYDFKINNKILEVHGTYWHFDPRFYNRDDIFVRTGKTRLVEEVWNKDIYKKQLAQKYGYEVFYIWEYDMKNMTDDEIFEYIKKEML